MANVYFALTEEFNRDRRVAVLSSGQAVVWYRLAMMSKDGDWIVREESAACDRILEVLAAHGARYRPAAPLDVEWLRGGWSSHFEFTDPRGLRIRCDFVSRPARVPWSAVQVLFGGALAERLAVVDLPTLIAIKRTQRAKDYPVIGALARLLPPAEELAVTIDPDRVLELARDHGRGSSREAVQLAMAGRPREDVVVAIAREVDRWQQEDRARMQRYLAASAAYLAEFNRQNLGALPLAKAHEKVRQLAAAMLPRTVE